MSGRHWNEPALLKEMLEMEKSHLRTALGTFMTGVTIVTVFDSNNEPWGVTANSFTSVSLDPPLVLVCIGKKGRTYPVFSASDQFAVNVLAASQQQLAMHFAGSTQNRFDGIKCNRHEGGAPILDNTAAWFDCRVRNRISEADHEILIGEVVKFAHTEQTPLGYCRGAFVTTQPFKENTRQANHV